MTLTIILGTAILLMAAYIFSMHVEVNDKKTTIKHQHDRINDLTKANLHLMNAVESKEEIIDDLSKKNADLGRLMKKTSLKTTENLPIVTNEGD